MRAAIVASPLGASRTSTVPVTRDAKNAHLWDTPRSRGFAEPSSITTSISLINSPDDRIANLEGALNRVHVHVVGHVRGPVIVVERLPLVHRDQCGGRVAG